MPSLQYVNGNLAIVQDSGSVSFVNPNTDVAGLVNAASSNGMRVDPQILFALQSNKNPFVAPTNFNTSQPDFAPSGYQSGVTNGTQQNTTQQTTATSNTDPYSGPSFTNSDPVITAALSGLRNGTGPITDNSVVPGDFRGNQPYQGPGVIVNPFLDQTPPPGSIPTNNPNVWLTNSGATWIRPGYSPQTDPKYQGPNGYNYDAFRMDTYGTGKNPYGQGIYANFAGAGSGPTNLDGGKGLPVPDNIDWTKLPENSAARNPFNAALTPGNPFVNQILGGNAQNNYVPQFNTGYLGWDASGVKPPPFPTYGNNTQSTQNTNTQKQDNFQSAYDQMYYEMLNALTGNGGLSSQLANALLGPHQDQVTTPDPKLQMLYFLAQQQGLNPAIFTQLAQNPQIAGSLAQIYQKNPQMFNPQTVYGFLNPQNVGPGPTMTTDGLAGTGLQNPPPPADIPAGWQLNNGQYYDASGFPTGRTSTGAPIVFSNTGPTGSSITPAGPIGAEGNRNSWQAAQNAGGVWQSNAIPGAGTTGSNTTPTNSNVNPSDFGTITTNRKPGLPTNGIGTLYG